MSTAEDKKSVETCVVWALDNTLRDGVLLQDPCVAVRRSAVSAIETNTFGGFWKISNVDGRATLESDFSVMQGFPVYMRVDIDDAKGAG